MRTLAVTGLLANGPDEVGRAVQDINDALNAFTEFTVQYQGAFDEPSPLFRHRAAAAAHKATA